VRKVIQAKFVHFAKKKKKKKKKKKIVSPREPLWIFLVPWPPWAGFLEELEMYKPSLLTSGKRKMGF
jgi:hypothetical protein